ncbi:MAG: serpin family protein [Bacilli bacterium]
MRKISNLETKIKASGRAYFTKRTAHLSFQGPLPKKPSWAAWPRIITWATSTAALGVTLTVMVSMLLGATQPEGSLPKAFTGIQPLNEVQFPSVDREQLGQEDALESFAYQQYINQISDYFQFTSQTIFASNDNVVYSPYSAYATLSLLLEAAGGETKTALEALLQTDSLASLREGSRFAFAQTYQLVTNIVNQRPQTLARSLMANGVFVRDDITVNPDYLSTLATQYFAEVFHTRFDAEGVEDIVSWLNQRTFDVLSMQPEDLSLNQDTALSLFNTLYLKANWQRAFTPLTNRSSFTNTANGAVLNQVSFMQKDTATTLYLDQPEFTLTVDQAYGDYRVVYVLPKGNIQPLALLSELNFPSIQAAFSETSVNETVRLTVPITTIQSKLDLKETLLSVYPTIATLFNPATADLSNALPNAFLQSLIQHVKIDMNPSGVEAAAITEANVGVTSAPIPPRVTMTLDRSYLYFLVNADGLLMFAGLVNQPNA